MKIVVKIGTQSLLSDHGIPIQSVFNSLVDQIAQLQANGHQIVLVSSGAVGFGRSIANQMLGDSSIGENKFSIIRAA